MRLNLLFHFLILTQLLSAQTFTEVTGTPFVGVASSSVAFSDVDGDGDDDLLITGYSSTGKPITKLYTNDGGSFTEVTGTPFVGVTGNGGSVAFSDVDGDGDNDLLITGFIGLFNWSANIKSITKLYTNDGGSFTEVTGSPFDGVGSSSVAFSDVDGDGDNDLLFTGSSERIAKLYTNDGGSFTEVTGTPFVGVRNSSVAFSDVDGDGDDDLLITGDTSRSKPIAKLYTNDGGSFTEVTGTPFDGIWLGSVAFSDVDGDGDSDLLIMGFKNSSETIAKLYTNDGGSFTEVTGTPFVSVGNGSVAFSDVDGDGDNDLLITGYCPMCLSKGNTKLYTNDGGSFTEVTGTPFDPLLASSVAFSDVDGDGDNDLLITGYNRLLYKYIAKLYTNDGLLTSTDHVNNVFEFDFTLYPNPTNSNNLNIIYDSRAYRVVNISLYDLNGRLLSKQEKSSKIGEQTFSIDIASLPQGEYLIELHDGKRKGVATFMVQ